MCAYVYECVFEGDKWIDCSILYCLGNYTRRNSEWPCLLMCKETPLLPHGFREAASKLNLQLSFRNVTSHFSLLRGNGWVSGLLKERWIIIDIKVCYTSK